MGAAAIETARARATAAERRAQEAERALTQAVERFQLERTMRLAEAERRAQPERVAEAFDHLIAGLESVSRDLAEDHPDASEAVHEAANLAREIKERLNG